MGDVSKTNEAEAAAIRCALEWPQFNYYERLRLRYGDDIAKNKCRFYNFCLCKNRNLVFHLNELYCLFGKVRGICRNRCDSLASVEYLISSQGVVAEVLDIGSTLTQFDNPLLGLRKILSGHHRMDSVESLGTARIDRADAGMSVGAAQHLAVQESR